MKLENYTYPQNQFIRYFVLSYVVFILIGCIIVYFGDTGIPIILIFMNLPIAILIFASFAKENYVIVNNNEIEVYNSFKAKKAKLNEIKKVEAVGNSWAIYLKNKQRINLTPYRIAKKDKTHFKKQMGALRDYLKKIKEKSG